MKQNVKRNSIAARQKSAAGGKRCTMTYPPHERKKWGAEKRYSPTKLRAKHADVADRTRPEYSRRRRPEERPATPVQAIIG